MKTTKSYTQTFVSILLVVLCLFSCNDEGDETKQSIFDRIYANTDYSSFKQILIRSGYDKMLSSSGAFTVFAPCNKDLEGENFSDEECEQLAKRYILSEALTISQLATRKEPITNLLGESVSINVDGETYKIITNLDNVETSATIIKADVKCNNGYLNITDDGTMSILTPSYFTILEHFWEKKEDALMVLNTCYSNCRQLVKNIFQLEDIRTKDKENPHRIEPNNSTLSDTYCGIYKLINQTNNFLKHVPSIEDTNLSALEKKQIIAEIKCIRAFAYYNLAMLWGDVIILTEPYEFYEENNKYTYPVQSKQADVYQFALDNIGEAIEDLPSSYNSATHTEIRFTKNAALMLKAEIELSLGRYNDAKNALNKVENTINFGFNIEYNNNLISIYTPQHLSLFLKEANGNTNDLEKEWAAMTESQYGYWAALKRLGKAQEVTGCFNHELLLPFPDVEFRRNPDLIQNPGYQIKDDETRELM